MKHYKEEKIIFHYLHIVLHPKNGLEARITFKFGRGKGGGGLATSPRKSLLLQILEYIITKL